MVFMERGFMAQVFMARFVFNKRADDTARTRTQTRCHLGRCSTMFSASSFRLTALGHRFTFGKGLFAGASEDPRKIGRAHV